MAYGKKRKLWKTVALGAGLLLLGALFKNKVLGTWKKIPVVGDLDLESKVGDNA